MRIHPICFALALTVPSLASAQMDAVLSAGATVVRAGSGDDLVLPGERRELEHRSC